ncbi:MAG: hypothetical protein COV74_09245 [Candidatus Omnitrophica bacterium CG11_big_fil_rev_8_21_14_0_20_45_26]|uniref:Glycosyl transferase family 1 domain-containing protein n=1 Tax=Candidatus Abzuiibacterium crystallinum TaxID=1974748 RepID=A0A2H0LNX9_9BACT|nr:MAG: hypothetical protein COV74_09245 [Candidatus Omnitrophica bacterium CG11_big_fil_rev_8_21_14_0_20_45_26]PIW63256.1 MAG: hypothetical protein COW12_11220 [Candidatus Omnitrophica bacterium CG12_big_fil_rev_8_21_14_0_65_45_16]
MANQKKELILGIFPSLGGSIQSQQRDRREGLFLNYYLPKYLKNFGQVFYFSYAHEQPKLPEGVVLLPNRLRLHRYLYGLLMPLFYFYRLRKCQVIRVMHLNGALSAYMAKKLYGIPYVVTYGYNYVNFAVIQGHHLRACLLKKFIPFLLQRADRVIVTTEELAQEVKGWIGKTNKVDLVPNGVDTTFFKPKKQKMESADFKLLFIGRLEKQKNLFFMLNVLKELKKHCQYQITMIGNGSLSAKLEQEVHGERLPVHFISRVPYESIGEYHQAADCLISTSHAEGHPKALIEAMSSGLACVVSNCPGNSSLIKHEVNGLCLAIDDQEKWVNALLALSHDSARRQQLGEQARKTILEKYDISMTLKKEVECLESCYGAVTH